MRFKISIITIFVFCLLLSFNSVFAIGIGAKPSSLNLDLEINQPKKAKILIYNVSQEAGIFQVYADELSEWIKVEPNNFRLEARETKEVEIAITAKDGGIKTTNISILATPLNRQSFSALSGIKIPLRLDISEDKLPLSASILETISREWFWLVTILIVFLAGFYLAKYFKERKLLKNKSQNNNITETRMLDDL